MKQVTYGFFGPRRDTPGKLPPGTIYVSYDTREIFMGTSDGSVKPIIVETESPDDPGFSDLENVIKINSVDDFPAAVNGVIELADPNPNTPITYIIGPQNIDIGSNRFTVTDGDVVIKGEHRTGSQITSTTTGNLFTSVDSNFFIEYVGFNCPSANFIDWSNPSGQVLSFATQNLILYSCINAGNIDGAFTTSLRTATIVSATGNGFSWSGLQSQINVSQFLALDWDGVLFDFGVSEFDVINFVTGSRFLSSAGSTIFKGLANNGNLKTDGRATIEGNLFNGDGIPLDGITTQDLKWNFSGNVFTDNTTPNSVEATDCYLTAPITVPISSSGVFVPIGGSDWSFEAKSRFTVGTDGLITYDGLSSGAFHVSSNSTVEKIGGGQDLVCVKIAINGVTQDKSLACTENTRPTVISSQGVFTLNQGDTVQLYIANDDSLSDIEVSSSSIIITRVI